MGKIKLEEIAVKTAGISAGAAAARLSDKFTGNLNPLIRGGGKIVGGALLPALMPKNKFIGHMADGIVAAGAIELFDKFTGGVSGISGVGSYVAAGMIDEDSVAGYDEPVSGAEDNNHIV